MWFLNNVTIKAKGFSEAKIIKICIENDIRVGNGWHERTWLGRKISDDDYPILMNILDNKRKHIFNKIVKNYK